MNVAYAYDSAGRFSAVTNVINGVTNTASYAYLPSSHLLTGYTLGALTRTVDFEPDRNLIDMATTTHGTNLISRFDYTNDPLGRRTQRLDTTGIAGFQPATNSFTYNVRSELETALFSPLGSPSTSSATYQYDPIGNRIQAVENTVQTDYVSNMLNQYTGINTNTPSYDDDGNMLFLPSTTGGGKQFTWDGENRMITTTNGNTVVVNTYDAQSRRIRKQVSVDGTPAKDIRYFYDAWNLLYEHDLLAGGSGSTRYYAWGLDLSQTLQGAGGVGGLLYTQAGTSSNAPSYDANGNVTEFVDLATGAVTSRQAYDGFGKTITQTGTRPAPYAFSTKYEDEETGLLYYGFRYYAPEIGRWPSRDLIGEMGGVNIYEVANNNLLEFIDSLENIAISPIDLRRNKTADDVIRLIEIIKGRLLSPEEKSAIKVAGCIGLCKTNLWKDPCGGGNPDPTKRCDTSCFETAAEADQYCSDCIGCLGGRDCKRFNKATYPPELLYPYDFDTCFDSLNEWIGGGSPPDHRNEKYDFDFICTLVSKDKIPGYYPPGTTFQYCSVCGNITEE